MKNLFVEENLERVNDIGTVLGSKINKFFTKSFIVIAAVGVLVVFGVTTFIYSFVKSLINGGQK